MSRLAALVTPERARAAFAASDLAIDAEHRDVMHEVMEGRAEAELIYEWAEARPPGGAER